MPRLWVVVLLGLCLVAGCVSRPETGMNVSYIAERREPAGDAAAFAVEADGVLVDRFPGREGGIEPFSTRSTLIVGPTNAIKAASPSPAEWIIIDTDRELPSPGYHPDYGMVRAAERSRLVVPDEATAVLAIGTSEGDGSSSIDVLLRATKSVPEIRFRAARRATEEETVLGRGGIEAQTIRVPWPLPLRDGSFVLAVPGVEGSSAPSLWRLRVRAIVGEEEAEARAIAASLASPAPTNAQAAALAASLQRAEAARDARRSTAFAALNAAAGFTSEVAILANDPVVLRLASAGADALSAPRIVDAGWTLDRSTLALLGKLEGEDALDRALAAAASARFGEVGRDVGTLARLAAASETRADFESRLTAEHLIYLDDASPSARVRAFDWLAARDAAPSGFDPLGELHDRREALDRHMESLAGGTRP